MSSGTDELRLNQGFVAKLGDVDNHNQRHLGTYISVFNPPAVGSAACLQSWERQPAPGWSPQSLIQLLQINCTCSAQNPFLLVRRYHKPCRKAPYAFSKIVTFGMRDHICKNLVLAYQTRV